MVSVQSVFATKSCDKYR